MIFILRILEDTLFGYHRFSCRSHGLLDLHASDLWGGVVCSTVASVVVSTSVRVRVRGDVPPSARWPLRTFRVRVP